MSRLHLDPVADWMTPEAFMEGGEVEKRTTHLRRAHGARCLTMWRNSVNDFAAGRPITASLIEQHNRQSLDHWCMARAAAHAVLDGQPAQTPGLTVPHAPQRRASRDTVARAFQWGRR